MEVMGKETEEEEVQDSTLRKNLSTLNKGSFDVENIKTAAGAGTNYPFKKWMDSFRSKKRAGSRIPKVYVEGWFDEPSTVASDTEISTSPPLQEQQWDRLSGGSSSILGTVKTASLSLATQSFATRSRANTHSSHQSASQSDNLSGFEMRRSVESVRRTTASMESAVRSRAGRRRHVLHEIFVSESNYVDGLQTLSKVSPPSPMTFSQS